MVRGSRSHGGVHSAVLVVSCVALLLNGTAVAARTAPTASISPADGRLRGEDFAAQVTSVAWPDQAVVNRRTVEATTGHRFVVFTLQLTEDTNAISPHGTDPAVTATLQWGQASQPLSLTQVTDAIAQQIDGSTWPSATQQFVASVPATAHTVTLVLSQGSFSQGFNLWTLQRVPPSPTVIYRDTQRPTVTSTTPATTTLALSNPSDGFSDSAAVSVQSATLSYFAPAGDAPASSSPSRAVLSVVLDGEYPNNPNDPTTSGHYLGAQSPLPGSMLTFTPAGGSPIPATMSDAGDTTGKGKADDGLFDARYSFDVSGGLTTGTLTLNAGSFDGTEFTLFTAESGNTTLDVSAPATLALTFPAVPEPSNQRTPPWVGAALPPTTAAVSSSTGASTYAPGSGGFPTWLAVLLLIVLAGGVVLWQRRRGARQRPAVVTPDVPTPTPARSPASTSVAPETAPLATADEAIVASASAPALGDAYISVLGPVEVRGWVVVPERRIVEELLCFLVLHDSRPMSADQIQAALRRLNGSLPEVSRKTFHTYLSSLRQCIGADHLPDANAAGYQVVGVDSDWAQFQALTRAADVTAEEEAIGHRRAALALVRGVPFEGVTAGQYEWVFNDQLASEMTAAIATCAQRLANDLFERGDYESVDDAVKAGLRAAPDDADLWRIGALALSARHEGRALRRHLGDAERHIEPEEMARLTASLGSHLVADDT